jgi:hypothetical protein
MYLLHELVVSLIAGRNATWNSYFERVLQSLKKLNIIFLLKLIIPIGTCSIDLKIIFTQNLNKIFMITLQSFQTGSNQYLHQWMND